VLPRFNPIPNTSAAFRRDVVLALGGYDPRYRYAMEYDLWLRVAERHIVVALDEPLSTRVMGTANVAARAGVAHAAPARARAAPGAGASAVAIAEVRPIKVARRRSGRSRRRLRAGTRSRRR
jgi:hypothetical protein